MKIYVDDNEVVVVDFDNQHYILRGTSDEIYPFSGFYRANDHDGDVLVYETPKPKTVDVTYDGAVIGTAVWRKETQELTVSVNDERIKEIIAGNDVGSLAVTL